MLVAVEYRLKRLEWRQTTDGQKNRKEPKALTSPPYAHEVAVTEAKSDARADAWRRRQQRSEVG